jgi:signal peptidase I
MPKFPRLPAIVNNFIMIILGFFLVIIWIAFAPLKIGGQASYVLVNGISMEPGFHGGDLAIVKAAPSYNVGDIITYSDPTLKEYVIHRIIGVKQDRYVLKGDNNSWVDPHQPTEDEILGKLWIHVPKLGLVMQWVRLPINMALAVVILGGVLMVGPNKETNQRGKKKNKSSGSSSTGWVEMAIYAFGFLALLFLALTIFSLTQPVARAAEDIKYEQTGIYYYSATSPDGIFDTEIIHSGEPIFTRLTCSIIIGFSYNITGPLQDVTGTQQLTAQVADAQSGWQRTIPLASEASFNGTSYSSTAPIDLCQFQDLVKTIGEKTGFQPITTLKIISKMAVSAKVGGQNLYDSFDSNLVFQFDNVHFYLVRSDENDPLQSSKSGLLKNPNMQANTLKFLGFEFSVLNMRVLGVGGLILTLLSLFVLALYIFEASQRSLDMLVRIRYGSMIMNVHDRGFENIKSVIDVTTIDDLAKLAERQNAMILHMIHDFIHYYFVQSDGTTYRFVNNENHNSQTNHTVRSEISPNEFDQDMGNGPYQPMNNEHAPINSLPKKVVISYDGPLPYNDQDNAD